MDKKKLFLFFLPVSMFVLVFSALVFFSDTHPLPLYPRRIAVYDGQADFYSNGRFVGTGSLPYSFEKVSGVEVTETRFDIPGWIDDGDVMSFMTGLASVQVLFDGNVVYEYLWDFPEDGMNDAGFLFSHYIELPPGAAGHEVSIIQRNMPTSYTNGQRDVFFGNKIQAELTVFSDGSYTIVFSLSMLFVSIIGFCLIPVSKDHDTRKALTALSQLALCMFLWLFSQTSARQLIIANPFLASSVGYWCIYFFPFLIYKYFIRNYELGYHRTLRLFSFSSRSFLIVYLVIGVLSLFGVVNMAQTVQAATVVVLVYSFLLLFFSIYLFVVGKEDVLVFILTMVSFIISFVIEEIALVFDDKQISSLFMHSFILLAAILIIYRTMYVFFFSNEGHDQRKKEAYTAYLDPLTGVKNRESYENFLSNTDAYLLGKKNMCVVIADLNRLKKINDTFGHDRGDHVLRSVAKALREVFSSKDTSIYRIGGDEFVVVFPIGDGWDVDAMLDELKRRADEEAGEEDVISAGKCLFNRRKIPIVDAVAAADLDMYVNKAESHAKMD